MKGVFSDFEKESFDGNQKYFINVGSIFAQSVACMRCVLYPAHGHMCTSAVVSQ